MRNVDIESFPGAVMAAKAPTTLFHPTLSASVTGVVATDVLTLATGTTPTTGTAVKPTTTTSGVTANTVYFINRIDDTTCYLYNNITNADTGGGTGRIDITATTAFTIATVNQGTINHIIREPTLGTRFYHDSNGRVWYLTDGGTRVRLLFNSVLDNAVAASGALANANGRGISTFQNSDASAAYLFAFRNALIDVINVTAGSNLTTPSWTNSWQTMNTGAGVNNSHHSILAQDNIVYFCDSRFIGSIREASGEIFNPATGTTYTFNSSALDTPQREVLEWLEELGANLLASGATWNKIYPWDRVSDSYNLPLIVPENNVQRLKNIGNLVYILAGRWGNIYTTQGTYVRHFKKIPDQVVNNSATLQSNPITWGGIDAVNGALLFGMSVQTTGNSGAYLLYPDGRLIIDNMPSTGSGNVTALEVQNNFYQMGYASGADSFSTSRYADYEGVVQSQFYRVATVTEKATYSVLEAVIAKPAATGGNIRISYRTNTSGSFTTIDTFASDGAATTFQTPGIGLMNIENIQVQIEIDDGSLPTDIELLEVRLLP